MGEMVEVVCCECGKKYKINSCWITRPEHLPENDHMCDECLHEYIQRMEAKYGRSGDIYDDIYNNEGAREAYACYCDGRSELIY